jgi:hypothetical protein
MSSVLDGLVALNDSILLVGVAMYFGTGWSTELFTVPVYPSLTVENYALHFVPQIKRAVRFFVVLATILWIAAGIMVLSEIRTWHVVFPAVVLAALLISGVLTMRLIFPINNRLVAGVHDEAELRRLLGRWIRLNRIRLAFWTIEMLGLAAFFAVKVR